MYKPQQVETETHLKVKQVYHYPEEYPQHPSELGRPVSSLGYTNNEMPVPVPLPNPLPNPHWDIQQNLASQANKYVHEMHEEGPIIRTPTQQHLNQQVAYYPPETDRPLSRPQGSIAKIPHTANNVASKPSFLTKMCSCFSKSPPVGNPTRSFSPSSEAVGQLSGSNCGCSRGINMNYLGPRRMLGMGYNGIGYDMVGPGCCDGPGAYFSPLRYQQPCCGCLPGQTRPPMPPQQGPPADQKPDFKQRLSKWCCF